MSVMHRLRHNRLAKSRPFRCFCSELIGTFILVSFVLSAVANATVNSVEGEKQAAAVIATIGSSLGVMIALYITFGVSGGHLNPVVTTALFSIGHVSIKDFILYQVAQYLGGFLAAALVYFLYSPMFAMIDGGERAAFGSNGTAHVFVTMPHSTVSTGRAFVDHTLNSGVFIMAVLAIVDQRNVQVPRYLQPFLIALTIMGIVQCAHLVSGATLNTARDLSPRLLAYMVGYGRDMFMADDHAFWLPLVGPYFGGVLGAWIYQIFFAWPLGCMRAEEEKAGGAEVELEMNNEYVLEDVDQNDSTKLDEFQKLEVE